MTDRENYAVCILINFQLYNSFFYIQFWTFNLVVLFIKISCSLSRQPKKADDQNRREKKQTNVAHFIIEKKESAKLCALHSVFVRVWNACSRNNYASVNITSEEKKKKKEEAAFDLAFNPPISITVFCRRHVDKFGKKS